MSEKTRKISTVKLVLGIMIPILVMVFSLVIVGVSFAWFNQSAVVEVETINLTVADVFVLSFSATNLDLGEYNGQNALGADNYLISKYRKVTQGKSDAYWDDRAFMFKSEINLSTQGTEVDLNLNLRFAQIQQYLYDANNDPIANSGFDLAIYGEEADNNDAKELDANKIPYAFTWFFAPASESNPLESDEQVTIYTPYGTMTLQSVLDQTSGERYKQVSQLVTPDGTFNNASATTISSYSIASRTPTGIGNFSCGDSEGTSQTYDFYIVFAPEKAFWMQFFQADRNTAYTSIYTSNELKNYVTTVTNNNPENRMYYSASEYTGAKFIFDAEVNVTLHPEA